MTDTFASPRLPVQSTRLAAFPSVLAPGKLTLAVPTLHEAGNLRELLDRTRTALDAASANYEIVVVDDDSRDGTEEIVAAVAQRDPRVRLLLRKGKRGLSGAVLHGWKHGTGDILGVMDADLQHPPELLPALLAAMNEDCDLVLASRFCAAASAGDLAPSRRIVSRLAIAAAHTVLRPTMRVADPMSGFFMVRRACVEGLVFQGEGFKLLLEILARAQPRSVREVPFAFGARKAGRSKASFKVGLQYGRLLLNLWRSRRERRFNTAPPPTDFAR